MVVVMVVGMIFSCCCYHLPRVMMRGNSKADDRMGAWFNISVSLFVCDDNYDDDAFRLRPSPLLFPSSGPALSGTLVQTFGFKWMLYGIAIINFLYAPFMYCLKSPPAREGEQQVSKGGTHLDRADATHASLVLGSYSGTRWTCDYHFLRPQERYFGVLGVFYLFKAEKSCKTTAADTKSPVEVPTTSTRPSKIVH